MIVKLKIKNGNIRTMNGIDSYEYETKTNTFWYKESPGPLAAKQLVSNVVSYTCYLENGVVVDKYGEKHGGCYIG